MTLNENSTELPTWLTTFVSLIKLKAIIHFSIVIVLNDYHDGRSNEATKFPPLSTNESILIEQLLLLSLSASDELYWISK